MRLETDAYEQAKTDPVAAVILDALHKQDAATYNGNAGDMGSLALATARDLREWLARQVEAAAPVAPPYLMNIGDVAQQSRRSGFFDAAAVVRQTAVAPGRTA